MAWLLSTFSYDHLMVGSVVSTAHAFYCSHILPVFIIGDALVDQVPALSA